MDPSEIESLIENRQYEALQKILSDMNSVDIAHLLTTIPTSKSVLAFRLLPKDLAIGAFEQMDVDYQLRLLEGFTTDSAREFVGAMSADDRANLLEEVPATVARRLLKLLPPAEIQATLELLGYEPGTAGRRMIPEFVDLQEGMTASEALVRIRRLGTVRENIDYAFVIDHERRLKGVVSLKDLILADRDSRVADLMAPNPRLVYTNTDQEEAGKAMRDYDLPLMPVVDTEARLVGTLTWDDMVDIMEQEVTEDIYRYGAVSIEHRYFTARLWKVVQQRGLWILFITLANAITGTIIAGQSELLTEVVILAAFIPLLIATGGSLGTQSSTVVIRGLATGEINVGRILNVMTREIGVGFLLGAVVGLFVLLYAFILGRQIDIMIVVWLTLVLISIAATTLGAALPFVFQKLKLDPAVVSAPMITTIMDVAGVLLYFGIAHLILRL